MNQPCHRQPTTPRHPLLTWFAAACIATLTLSTALAGDATKRPPVAQGARKVQALGSASSGAKPFIGSPVDGNGIRSTTTTATAVADKVADKANGATDKARPSIVSGATGVQQISWSGSDGDDVCEKQRASCKGQSSSSASSASIGKKP